MNNSTQFSCDGIPNTVFSNGIREGASFVEGMYNILKYSELEQSYCDHVNNDPILRNGTINARMILSNETLMQQYLLFYLESLIVDDNRNFTLEHSFWSEWFDVQVDQVPMYEIINAFNYYMFCREGNDYFDEFHKVWLPNIVRQSKYEQVQTLEVLFGNNVVKTCGKSELIFFNRTMLCFCTSSQGTIHTLSMYDCSGPYVSFWVPLSYNLGLKIFECVIYFFQLGITFVIIGIPISSRYFKKWNQHLIIRRNVNYIEKEKTQKTTNDEKKDNEPKERRSMKDEMQFELLRVLCDLKMLALFCVLCGIVCLVVNSLIYCSVQGSKGTAVYPSTTLLIASLCFLCVGNVPLALSFVEILLKLSNSNKKVSILGL